MMSKKMNVLAILLAAGAAILAAAVTKHATADGRGSGPIVYVTGQELFFDSIVLTDLPQHGPFQLLEMGGPNVGGRWWVDANGNGEMDDEDAFFMCPLLGPGREEA
jgi:hypothetical protein